MKEHRINVYIPEDTFKKIHKMDGTLKQNVCTILAQGLHSTGQTSIDYNQDLYVIQLRSEILYLRGIHQQLMNRATLLPENASGTMETPFSSDSIKVVDIQPSKTRVRVIKTKKKESFCKRLFR